MAVDVQQLSAELNLKGNYRAEIAAAKRGFSDLDRAASQAATRSSAGFRGAVAGISGSLLALDRNTRRTQRSFSQFGQNLERAAKVGAVAVAGGVLAVVKAASDYESAFAGVRKTVSATDAQLDQLSQQFRDLAKTIPISAAEFARLGEAGGALGVPTAQLKEFVRVTALLGVTTNLTSDEAANSLGILGNVLHLTGAEYSKFASSLVALGNAGASTESQIIEIAQRAGAAGELIGLTTQQVLGLSSATASLGIETEAGGTALQKFFIDSAKSIAKGGTDLKVFARTAGESTKAFQQHFRRDAGGALQEFLAGLGKLPQAAQLNVLEKLGFTDARITRTLLGLAGNTKLVGEQMNVANTAFQQNTALTKEAEQRFQTFDSQVTILKNNLTDAAITIGAKLLPKITPLVQRLTQFIKDNQGKIGDFGDKLAKGFEDFGNAAQKIDWGAIVGGLQLTGQAAKTIVDAFLSLPPDVQKIAIAALAINKVTGGLPTSIIKDLGGLALRSLTTINAAHVTVVGGTVTGGGVPGVAGGGSGLLGKVFALSIAGAIVAAAVPIGQEFAAALPSELKGPGGLGESESQRRIREGHAAEAIPVRLVGDLSRFDTRSEASGIRRATAAQIRAAEAQREAVAGVKDAGLSLRRSAGDLRLAAHAQLNAAKADFRAAEKARGSQLRLSFAGSGKAGSLAEVRYLAREFDKSQKPFYRSQQNANRYLSYLQAAERTFLARGDTHSARTVHNAISTMRRVLAGKADATSRAASRAGDKTAAAVRNKKWAFQVNNTIQTTTTVSNRDTIHTQTTAKRYGNVYLR